MQLQESLQFLDLVPDLYLGYLVCIVNQTLHQVPNYNGKLTAPLSDAAIQRDLASRGIPAQYLGTFTLARCVIHSPSALLALCL